jgi:hypothetical protein
MIVLSGGFSWHRMPKLLHNEGNNPIVNRINRLSKKTTFSDLKGPEGIFFKALLVLLCIVAVFLVVRWFFHLPVWLILLILLTAGGGGVFYLGKRKEKRRKTPS